MRLSEHLFFHASSSLKYLSVVSSSVIKPLCQFVGGCYCPQIFG